MDYPNILPAQFVRRPNRFIAEVLIDGTPAIAHVKNTGRCRELLILGARVWLTHNNNPKRKTAYDLIAVEKGSRLINMDSQAPNTLFAQWAKEGNFVPNLSLLRPEVTYGSSRFDFYWEAGPRRGFVEVKGVTLEENGVARFPDAPTLRGVKHIEELIRCQKENYEATICFVIQMEAPRVFEPNEETHPAFGAALRNAAEAGVTVLAMDCLVSPGHLNINKSIPILL